MRRVTPTAHPSWGVESANTMLSKSVRLALLLATATATACNGDGNDPGGPDNTPAPIASLHLDNGNEINFYDFGVGALVTEMGAAYTPPALDGTDVPAGELVNTWKRLAPKTPVPNGLVELQDRLLQTSANNSAAAPAVSAKAARMGQAGGDTTASSQPLGNVLRTLVGCNNGCCDEAWLRTLYPCSSTWDWEWFLFNYLDSYANHDDIYAYRGLVCAATGTSKWTINVGGTHGPFQVQEAHYLQWNWTAGRSIWCGGFCGEDMHSTVNSQSDQHLHTYCGKIGED
jgi:hypothetical protein